MIAYVKNLARRAAIGMSNRMSPRELIRELRHDDTGASTVELVIIVAVLVIVAGTVLGLLATKTVDKAKSISF